MPRKVLTNCISKIEAIIDAIQTIAEEKGYNELMKNGWRMKEIDEMDMLGFLRLRAWDATREQEKKKPRQRFIDEVWPGMKPG